jgi:hypothetical protein
LDRRGQLRRDRDHRQRRVDGGGVGVYPDTASALLDPPYR